jgi:Zn-dependent peptidase ImmA (M78 family)/transcriptional regulator with XRE-family HTH domain
MIGVAGFVSDRLKEARESRGLTAVALADMIGMSAITLSNYENGRSSPRAETLEKIASTLGFPRLHFTRKHRIPPHEAEAVFWRSFSYATKSARTKCRHRLHWLQEIVAYIAEHLDFPTLNLPALVLPTDILDLTLEDVEEMAYETRRSWRLGSGPIEDTLLLMENNGVVMSRFEFEANGLDAFSNWGSDDLPYVILSGDNRTYVRTQYNAAHELAHLILHRSLTDRSLKLPERHKVIEDQAFRFASALLLPASSFTAELWAPTLDAFVSLKRRWRVSIGVMIKRCRELELTTDLETKNLWIAYTRRGYRRQEVLDREIGPPAELRLLRRSIELLVEERIKSPDQISAEIALPEKEIEQLCGLRPGYFSAPTAPPVINLPRPKQQGQASAPRLSSSSLIEFSKRK